MAVTALGYVGVRTKALEDWAGFATALLGMQLTDKSRKSLAFRMDDRKQRLVVAEDGGSGAAFYGWEVADAPALDTVAARLEANKIQFARGSRALAQERRVADLIVLNDPGGNRIEIFHGAEVASDPFKPGRSISGFRTGPLGMGHAVVTVARIDEMIAFYQENLGFRLSDFVTQPLRINFFHVNPRHHSLAFAETGKNGLHHLMVELFNLDDVGQGYDIAQTQEGRIATTLGRHINDQMTSFYNYTPSDFMVEYGWGGLTIDDEASWEPVEVKHGPSLWGHDRNWVSAEAQEHLRGMRMQAAAEGLRAPVNVVDGNYRVAPGTCPWFDQARRAGGMQAAE
ncbi:MAG TPA: VOC family protein [Xanthobacteraceae bacterium]|nr:VOC family protein [Xanthobacteraceae bacterium]